MSERYFEEPLSLQLQIDQLKSIITPMTGFIEEALNIKTQLNLPINNSYSIIDLLSLKAKSDLADEISLIKKSFGDFQIYITDTNRAISSECQRLHAVTQDMRNEINVLTYSELDNKETIKEIRHDVNSKAHIKDLIELKKFVDSMTPLQKYEEHEERLNELALKSSVNEV